MSPKVYFRMEHSSDMIIEMDMKELVFNDGSEFILWYDFRKNITLLYDIYNEHITKFVVRLYKCITDTKN